MLGLDARSPSRDATVVDVAVEALDVPLLEPFGIAGGVQAAANNLLVTIALADGTRGFGEAAPLPAFNGETQSLSREAIERAAPLLLGHDARAFARIVRRIAEATGGVGSAICALEMALFDAITKRAGMSLLDFYGGASRALETDITLPLGTAEHASIGAHKAVERGFSALKIKVGSRDLELDTRRVVAAHAAAPRAAILLDANGGLSALEAIELWTSLDARGVAIALFEQPTPPGDLDALALVAERVRTPVAADESITTKEDVVRIARATAVRAVNIKLMKSGLEEARAIAFTARALGLDLMIGGMVETRLAMGTSACLAAGLGGFSYVDLDTPLFMAFDPFEGGYSSNGPILDLSPIAAGHGTAPRQKERS